MSSGRLPKPNSGAYITTDATAGPLHKYIHALCSVTCWRDVYEMLRRDKVLTLSRLSITDCSPGHWDACAIATALHEAALGFTSHPVLGPVLPDIVHRAEAAKTLDRTFKVHQNMRPW